MTQFLKGGYRWILKSNANTLLDLERKNMKKIFLITLIFMTLIFKTIWAEEKKEEVIAEVAGEAVIVTADRVEEPLSKSSASVTVVTKKELEDRHALTVFDVLRGVPGLDVTQQGDFGKLATIRIRGASSNQVLVMIDGVQVNDPSIGTFDFADLNIDNIERVEIIRGAQSTLYGSDSMAGTINIITKKGVGKPSFNVSSLAGSFGTFKENFGMDGAFEKFNYALTFSRTDSEGRFRNDGYRNTTASAQIGFKPFKDAEIRLITRYTEAKKELSRKPGFDPVTFEPITERDHNSTQRNENSFSSLNFEQKITEWWDHTARISFVYTDLVFRDPLDSDEVSIFPAPPGKKFASPISSETYNRIMTGELQHNFRYKDIDVLTVGYEFEERKGRSFDGIADKKIFQGTMINNAYFVQNKLNILERLLLVAGLRYDDNTVFGNVTTPRISGAFFIKETGTKIKSSWSKAFRAPNFSELFYKDPFFVGNPNLSPERSRSFEVGIEQDILEKFLHAGVTFFHDTYQDLILFVPAASFTKPGTLENVSRARTQGVEIDATLTPGYGFIVKGSYTYLDAKNFITRERLQRRPRNKWAMNVNYDYNTKLNLNLNVIGDGRQPDNKTNGSMMRESYTRVDLSGAYEILKDYGILKQLKITGRVENLFNEHYEEILGFPSPGINFLAGVQLSF